MAATTYRGGHPVNLLKRIPFQRGFVFGMLIIIALFAFETFNYSTTDFALGDLLGDLRFLGVRWATILAIAFCGIDFAGIARLFTPEKGADEPAEVWYLFGAWLMAAAMNAALTWWGVSLAIVNHQTMSNVVIERQTLVKVVPIFVAVMIWLIRVLIIGTFSVAGERLLWQDNSERARNQNVPMRPQNPIHRPQVVQNRPVVATPISSFRPAPKTQQQQEHIYTRPEPTYHPVGMSGRDNGNHPQQRS